MQNSIDLNNFKFLTKEEIIISLDRLTRFKQPDISYPRVFRDIIHKTSLSPHISDRTIDEILPEIISEYIQNVWKKSISQFEVHKELSKVSDRILKDILSVCFDVQYDYTKVLMNTFLDCSFLIDIDDNLIPKNLRVIKYTLKKIIDGSEYSVDLLLETSETKGLLYPIQKLILVEGITEDILLPKFADFLNKTLQTRGIYIYSAGGKTKIPVIYSELKDCLKIPVIVVFDNDAKDLSLCLQPNLRKCDSIIVNEKGEFEDLLSLNLIKRTLNSTNYNSESATIGEFRKDKSMCRCLEEYYRVRKLGEFKKAQFAKLLSENIKYSTDVSDDIRKLVDLIIG